MSGSDELTTGSILSSPEKEILRVKVLAEVATMVALSGALYAVKVFTLPQGGSITLASMVPVFLLAFRRGPRVGILAGVAFGLVALAEDQFIYYPAQVILDYPLAFGLLGLAGFFPRRPILGVVVAVTARFCSHFISGILFFASSVPPGENPYVYSASYNGSFLIPEMIITVVILSVLIKAKALELYL